MSISSSSEVVVSHWERSAKTGTRKTYLSCLRRIRCIKLIMHPTVGVRQKMVVFFIFIIIILLCSSLPEGHGLHPFRWIANGVQRCVKTHKQHLQEWQPGIPSVPHSPSKSAHVRSHLLRPSSLLPLPCFFSQLLPCRRPIFHLDC